MVIMFIIMFYYFIDIYQDGFQELRVVFIFIGMVLGNNLVLYGLVKDQICFDIKMVFVLDGYGCILILLG